MEPKNISELLQYSIFNSKLNEISLYIYPIMAFTGILTNILNICILRRRALLISPCPYYFLAFALSSLLYICIRCTSQFLRIYSSNNTFLSDTYCKIEAFAIYLLPVHATLMLVFASFDRFCRSSLQKSHRDLSQIYLAKIIIFISTILTVIYFLPFLFIIYWDRTINDCYQDSAIISTLYLSSRVILLYMLLPIALVIFGFLTIRNISRQRIHAASIVINLRSLKVRRNESQLARMLLVQVGVYLIFSLPAAVTYPILTFIPSMNTPLMTGIRSVAILWQLCIFLTSFIFYILSSQIYRNECIRMLKLNNVF